MAKKTSDESYKSFLADVLAAIPEDKRAAVQEAIDAEPVQAKLKSGVLARDEFSRQMDEVKSIRQQLDGEVTEARTKIAGWQKWYNENLGERTTLVDKLKKYEEEYGALDGETRAKYLREDDFRTTLDAEIRKRESALLKFTDDLTDLKIEHRQKFGEKLNTEDVYKIAGERNIPLDMAYTIYTADKVKERNDKDFSDKLKAAREEGAREALSKHNLPGVSSNHALGVHAMDVTDAPKSPRDRIAAAVAGFTTLHNEK